MRWRARGNPPSLYWEEGGWGKGLPAETPMAHMTLPPLRVYNNWHGLMGQVNVKAGGKAGRMRPKEHPPKVRRREKTRAEKRNAAVDCTTNS